MLNLAYLHTDPFVRVVIANYLVSVRVGEVERHITKGNNKKETIEKILDEVDYLPQAIQNKLRVHLIDNL